MNRGYLFAAGIVLGYLALYVYSVAVPGEPPPDWRPDMPDTGTYGQPVD